MSSASRIRILILAALLAGSVALVAIMAAVILPQASQGVATVGGPFTLISQDGKPGTQAVLDGHPTLVFFGYTHCPDACPTALAAMSSVFKALGTDTKPRALFITVDPERDTPPVMKDYMESFDPHILGLTGTPAQIKKVEADYKVYAKAVPDKDGTYSMDHTAITYLMNKDGQFVGGFNLDQPPAAAAAELKRYE